MRVNGNFVALGEIQSLYDFLTKQNYDFTRIAVEHNGKIVPKGKYKDVLLEDEDNLEIVQFVGGG